MLPHPPDALGFARPRLHYHPVAASCRPLMMFADEAGLRLDWREVDIFSGAQFAPAFTALNPSQTVPVLEDGDFRLCESSAILKYLADRSGSPAYPREPRQRARVNEAMDWLLGTLARELVHGYAYPQLLPRFRRAEPAEQEAALRWAAPRAARCLDVLDGAMLGRRYRFVAGTEITLADYQAMAFITLGEAVHVNYAPWPQVQRWLTHMKSRPAYGRTQGPFERYVARLDVPPGLAPPVMPARAAMNFRSDSSTADERPMP